MEFSKSHNGIQLNLKGIIPPMITPFLPGSEELDIKAIQDEAEYLISTGVPGICVGGSTGEGQGLSEEEIYTLCKTVVDQANGRVQVIGGVISDSTADAMRKSQAAKNAGVNALQLTPPHYLWSPNTEGLVQHFQRVGDAIELPIIIYNVIPWVDIDVHSMNEIIDRVPWVLGVKQSGGDMHKVADMLDKIHSKVPITTGIDDLLFPTFVLGVDGAISCLTAVFPELTQELYQKVQNGDYNGAKKIHDRLLPIWRSIEGPTMPYLAKVAIEMLGRKAGVARSPILAPTEEKRSEIRQRLEEGGFITAVKK
ncbi:dihydrodipicolinate synthase family protein [Bacillus sp. Marseille-P3661]|uniref:dihydrodipicolinate synthase family protein n=1 Tax=Bacillus sp. Marseille-P3661 TaxID=1936234 RepID=UPI000C81A234|nr:dihydrodipicolinate synthase family protein [Bacillus sp. Marseille-P3661]